MAATLNVYQQRQNIQGGFRVTTTVQSATGIPTELFVMKQSDNSFSHVAAIEDFFYPTQNTVGITNYRAASVARDFTEIDTALRYATHVKARLLALADAYNDATAQFVGTETTVIGG